MDTWHIATSQGDPFGITDAADGIALLGADLRSALESVNRIAPIWELWDDSQSVGRAVVQVPVGTELFEKFFNSSNGYRAMFRRGRRIGSATNAGLIDVVRSLLSSHLPKSIGAILVRKVRDGLQLAGHQNMPLSTFLRSLDPSLAKVWYATEEITSESIRWLSSGVSDSKIDVGLEHTWSKIEQNAGDCIIEVKGAFVGSCGLFQVKDPELRAIGLSTTGAA